jgi:hypothetical protein
MLSKNVLVPVLLAGSVLCFAISGHATVLNPGGDAGEAVATGNLGADSTFVTGDVATSTYQVNNIGGTVSEAVYLDGVTNDLDFVYQFTNTGGSRTNGSVGTFLASAWNDQTDAGWESDVYFNDSALTALNGAVDPSGVLVDAAGDCSVLFPNCQDPFQATRSTLTPGTPQTIGFNFHFEKGTSALLIIKTNAPAATAGTVSLGTAGPLDGFFAPVPEPGFYGILAAALGLIFVAVKLRKNNRSTRATH